MIFMEMACKHIYWLICGKRLGNYTSWVQPIVEDENASLGVDDKSAVEDIGEFHFRNSLGISSQTGSSLMIFGAAFPASTNIFLSLR